LILAAKVRLILPLCNNPKNILPLYKSILAFGVKYPNFAKNKTCGCYLFADIEHTRIWVLEKQLCMCWF